MQLLLRWRLCGDAECLQCPGEVSEPVLAEVSSVEARRGDEFVRCPKT